MKTLFFIDDDIVFNPMEVPKIAQLMIKNNLDICGGAYTIKQPEKPHFAIKALDAQPIVFGEKGNIVEVKWLATGFMAIHRRVLEEMVKKEIYHLCHPNDMKFYPFFASYEKYIDGSWIFLSEDYAFCEKARDLGLKKLTRALKEFRKKIDEVYKKSMKEIDEKYK